MAMKKTGLGKGLDALFITGPLEEEKEEKRVVEKVDESEKIHKIKINEIEPNKNQPRRTFNNESNYHDFVCIDGLQRYTAIKRFINNEIKVFGCYLNEIEDKDKMLRRVEMRLNINSLKSKKDVLKWYIQINDGGTPHTKEEIERVKKLYNEELGK